MRRSAILSSWCRPWPLCLYPSRASTNSSRFWRALYQHQSPITPHLHDRAVSVEAAWETRRRIEREWLRREPDSFVLAAEEDGRYVGYAFTRVRSGKDFAASWRVSDPLGELATLAVLPQHRNRGLGSALLDAVEERLAQLRVQDMIIGVITTNLDAMRLYQRRGAVPFVTELVQRIEPSGHRAPRS